MEEMKALYVAPEISTVEMELTDGMLTMSVINVTDEENKGPYDVKEENLTDEELYRIFLNWD